MEIRVATLEDVDAVRRVAHASWQAAHGHILGAETVERLLEKWYTPEVLGERIRRDDAPIILAITDYQVVGFAQGVPGEDENHPAEAVVGSLYVQPEYWGKGSGTALLEHLFDAFRERGWTSVCLTVLADNDIARSFYDKHGFDLHEERTVQLAGQKIDDVVLVRTLPEQESGKNR